MNGNGTPGRGTVLVTDADRGSAVAIIRSLGRKGWRVIAADSDRRSLGFHSRYAAGRLIYPSPRSEPAALVERLLAAVEELDVDLLIPVTDEIIQPLAHARDRFEGLCRLAIAEAQALETVTDKAKTLALARSLGVPVPARSSGKPRPRVPSKPLMTPAGTRRCTCPFRSSGGDVVRPSAPRPRGSR